jgi:hypothetical protein
MTMMLDVLIEAYTPENLASQIEIPDKLLESFGDCCSQAGLIDSDGKFNNPHKLVKFFCLK